MPETKRRTFMKRKYKVLIAIGIVLVIIAGAAFGVYEFYGKQKIEETLEKAQQVLTDENLRKEVDAFVLEMEETGVLDELQVQTYNEQKENYVSKEANETERAMTLMEKVKAAMTAEEFAFAMSMYGKVDVGYVLSHIHTNRAAAKKHIKSVLTSDEISKSLAIYNKYSYLLK